MKTDILKQLIKEAVKEAIHDELKDILLEAVKAPKMPVNESTTLNFTTKNIPHQAPKPAIDTKKAYMDILGEMAQGPSSGFAGDFQVNGPVNTMSDGSSLPGGQLGLDQIMGLIGKK